VNLQWQRKLSYEWQNIAIIRHNPEMVADCGSTESAESVGQTGNRSNSYEEPLDVVSFAWQIQPVFVA